MTRRGRVRPWRHRLRDRRAAAEEGRHAASSRSAPRRRTTTTTAATPMRRCISRRRSIRRCCASTSTSSPRSQGDLADSWQVAPDLMTYTFKLKSGVKFHDGTDLTSADVKASYDRLRNPPQGVVSTRKATFDDIGTIETPDSAHRHLQDEGRECLDARALRLALERDLRGEGPCRRSERAEDQDQRHRAVHLRRARQGQPRVGQAQRELLQEGLAASRRLPRRVHAAGRRDAQRRAGRTGARRIPRHLAGRARPPRAGDGRQDPHRGVELDAQPAGLLQRREEAVRRRARAQGAADGDRPLGRQHRPLAHLDAALGRRRDPPRLAVRDAGGRTGEAPGLLQGHQGVARGGQEAARRSRTVRT